MNDNGVYPVKNYPKCNFEGCKHNVDRECDLELADNEGRCEKADIPYWTCDFCGSDLVTVEHTLTCPNGCF